MADYRDQFTTEIYVNEQQANDALGKLREKVDQTAKAYEKLLNTKDADTAKTEKARKAWEAAKSSLDNVEKGVAEYGKALKNLSGQSMNNLLKMQQKINAELKKTKPDTAEWQKLANEYAQVTNRLKDLRKVQDEITTRSGGLKGALERVSAAGNKFGLAIMAIPTAIKSITATFSGVINVTKQVINASQTLGDKWNNGIAAMKTSTEAFFFALSTGDFTAFENGLGNVLKKARQLAETMDQLGSYNIAEGYMQSKYLTDYQTNITTATDTEADAEARRKALDDAKADLDAYNEFIQGKAATTYKALQEEFDVYLGKTFESQEEFDQFFDKLFRETTIGANEAVNEANAYMKEQYSNYAKQYQVTGDQIVYTYTSTEARALATADAVRKYGQETIDLARAAELNDEKHKALIETYSQYRNSVNLLEQREKQYNRTRDRVTKQLDETTKKTGGATKATDAYTEAIKKIDKAQSAQILIWKQQYAAGLIDKTRYEAEKAVIEEDFLKQKMATAEKYGKDTDQFMSQLLDRQIARMDKAKAMLKEEADEMARYYEGLRTGDERQFGASTGSAANGGIADQEAYDSFQEKIWQKAADIRAAITEDSARTEYETEVMWAQKLAEQKKITAEEAEKYILQAKLKYAQAAAQQVGQITEQASNFVTALKEAESAQLEAEYQKQLTAAGDNAERREQIDAEYEQKKLDLQKKYADIDMAINIAKTVANGAAAVVKALADPGGVAGYILAGLVGATTAAEVATIIAQRNAIKNASVSSSGSTSSAPKTGERKITGYSQGGFTPKAASDSTAVGVVHANEYVAPAWMVRRNPVMFANLEQYRQRGYAEGGYTGKGLGTMGVTERPARPPKRGPSTGSGTGPSTGPMDGGIETIVRVAVREELPSALKAMRVVLVRRDLTELDAQTEKFEEQTSR